MPQEGNSTSHIHHLTGDLPLWHCGQRRLQVRCTSLGYCDGTRQDRGGVAMMPTSLRRLAVALGLPTVWFLLWCVHALAHAGIVERQPDDRATLQLPEQVRLRFNEPIEAG